VRLQLLQAPYWIDSTLAVRAETATRREYPKRFVLARIKDTLPGPVKRRSLGSLAVFTTVVHKTEPTGCLGPLRLLVRQTLQLLTTPAR